MMDENQQLVFIEYFFLTFISENYNAKNTYLFCCIYEIRIITVNSLVKSQESQQNKHVVVKQK